MIPSLLELALRALLVAAAVGAGLVILRVRDVLAQKIAWGLVLCAAVVMPLVLPMVMRWQIVPSGVTLALPAHPLEAAMNAAAALSPATVQTPAQQPATDPSPTVREFAVNAAPTPAIRSSAPLAAHSGSAVPRSTIEVAPPVERRHAAPAPRPLLPSLRSFAFALYLAVCAVLLLRMVFGLTSAISLWLDADPVPADVLRAADLDSASGLRLRSSRAVASPVTIGSGVVLPANYDEWDAEKLRIVIAHERSHIDQRDFYLQLLAGVYATLFWFSPLGWWLKRKLSDLGEAISDRAGLKEAASRSSYAQVLLEFAAAPRPTLIGVAMARPSSLSQRIERLLNESSFRQAFAGSRVRAMLAVLLVPAALIAATAFIRVEAAGRPVHDAIAGAQNEPVAAGQSNPDQARYKVPPAAPRAVAPVAPVAPPPALAPVAPLAAIGWAPSAPVAPAMARAPYAPRAPMAVIAPAIAFAGQDVAVGGGQSLTIRSRNGHRSYMSSGVGNGYSFVFDTDGDSYALVTDPKAVGIRFSGDWMDGRSAELKKAAAAAHGGFLWFTHEGKSYIVDDQGIVSGIDAMYKPMEELGRQQEELGKKQEELGRQQEELGKKQEQASVPTPDLSKEIAELNASLAKLQAKKGSTITQEELGDIQGKIGDIQGRIGDIEGTIGEAQGKLGEEQGKLGEKQGELGEQQGKLGEQQGRIAEEVDKKIKGIIDESMKNGKARPVE